MMIERGIQVDHSTIMRWVHQYFPEIETKIRRYLRPTNYSWKVDETYIKGNGKWKYFYLAVDSNFLIVNVYTDFALESIIYFFSHEHLVLYQLTRMKLP